MTNMYLVRLYGVQLAKRESRPQLTSSLVVIGSDVIGIFKYNCYTIAAISVFLLYGRQS